MTELKTQPNDGDVHAFIAGLENDQTRRDCQALLELMQEISGAAPQMWGDSIVGFGKYRYKYASGQTGEWFRVGFAPRKQNLTLYLMGGIYVAQNAAEGQNLLTQLGKHKLGKGCLYIKKLSDVDMGVLRELVQHTVNAQDAG